MSTQQGLISCSSDWTSGFCVTKTFETIMSSLLIIWIIYEIVNYYHFVRVIKSSFILFVQILMLLTLTFNIAFSVYHTTYPLLYIQIYFYNMYFAVLCFFLIFNVFKRIKYMRALVGCFIGFLALVYLMILIDSFIQSIQMCKQLSYLIMNGVGTIISIIMFLTYRYNEVKEMKRIQKLNKILASDQIVLKDQNEEELIKMKTPSRINFNQPFRNMWLMIICNIICQIVDLVQSLTFKLKWSPNEGNTCPVSQNYTVSAVVNFIFNLFTFYLGFTATIFVFRQKRKARDISEARIKSPSDLSSVQSGKNILQMVGKQSFSISYQNPSSAADNLSQLYHKLHK